MMSVAQEFRDAYSADIQNVVAESNGTATENDVIRFAIDDLLIEQTGQPGFVGYLHWTAQDGFSLDSTRSSSEIPVSASARPLNTRGRTASRRNVSAFRSRL